MQNLVMLKDQFPQSPQHRVRFIAVVNFSNKHTYIHNAVENLCYHILGEYVWRVVRMEPLVNICTKYTRIPFCAHVRQTTPRPAERGFASPATLSLGFREIILGLYKHLVCRRGSGLAPLFASYNRVIYFQNPGKRQREELWALSLHLILIPLFSLSLFFPTSVARAASRGHNWPRDCSGSWALPPFRLIL